MCSIMAGAKSGIAAAGPFCASATCNASSAKKTKATARNKLFAARILVAMAEILRRERMMIVSAVGLLNKNSTTGCGRYTGLYGTAPPPNKVGPERYEYGFLRVDQIEDAHATRAAKFFREKLGSAHRFD